MRHSSRSDGRRVIRVGLIIVILSLSSAAVSTRQRAAAPHCQPAEALVRIADLPEASGVAVSRRLPGRLWAHNDSGEAVPVALDTRGSVTGRVRVSGVKIDDWEAVGCRYLSRGFVHLHRGHWRQ
jgi:hypothetical protein